MRAPRAPRARHSLTSLPQLPNAQGTPAGSDAGRVEEGLRAGGSVRLPLHPPPPLAQTFQVTTADIIKAGRPVVLSAALAGDPAEGNRLIAEVEVNHYGPRGPDEIQWYRSGREVPRIDGDDEGNQMAYLCTGACYLYPSPDPCGCPRFPSDPSSLFPTVGVGSHAQVGHT